MFKKCFSKKQPNEPTIYQIRVEGHLGSQWTDWFDGMAITQEDNGTTLLTGAVRDQAALHGLFKLIRDLGMPLISLNRIESKSSDNSEING